MKNGQRHAGPRDQFVHVQPIAVGVRVLAPSVTVGAPSEPPAAKPNRKLKRWLWRGWWIWALAGDVEGNIERVAGWIERVRNWLTTKRSAAPE